MPSCLFAQEANMNTPFWINRSYFNASCVAYMSNNTGITALLTTKKLWSGVKGAPRINGLAIDYNINNKNFVGFQMWKHQYATLSYTSVAIPYAFNAIIDNEHRFLLGVTSSFTSTTLDLSRITQPELLDINAEIPEVVFFDASFGGSYCYKDVFRFGIFGNNFILNGKVDPTRVINYTNYSLSTFGADMSFYKRGNNQRPLSMYFDILVKSNPFTPIIGEVSARLGKYGSLIGAGYRSNKDLNVCFQVGVDQAIEFGYFYTHSFSDLQRFSDGSHQLYLRFAFLK
jgi:type IX secretion system PorP/SprF family membrane protein